MCRTTFGPSKLTNTGWLSPELYLRRPPAKNEQYRVDRMLQAAAQRGVKVNIIVYKEVPTKSHIANPRQEHKLTFGRSPKHSLVSYLILFYQITYILFYHRRPTSTHLS